MGSGDNTKKTLEGPQRRRGHPSTAARDQVRHSTAGNHRTGEWGIQAQTVGDMLVFRVLIFQIKMLNPKFMQVWFR